jgi:hypothetical protein
MREVWKEVGILFILEMSGFCHDKFLEQVLLKLSRIINERGGRKSINLSSQGLKTEDE